MKPEYAHEYSYIKVGKYRIVRAYMRCEVATRKAGLYRIVPLEMGLGFRSNLQVHYYRAAFPVNCCKVSSIFFVIDKSKEAFSM